MYVCVCHGISEKRLRQAVQEGACSFEQLQSCTSFNVIAATVLERTAEIGALRANGESRLAVFYGMVIEAAALGLLGGFLGIAAGWALCAGPLHAGISMPPAPGITRSYRIAIALSSSDIFEVLALSAMTAIAGCMLPVMRAARMPIAAALRHV